LAAKFVKEIVNALKIAFNQPEFHTLNKAIFLLKQAIPGAQALVASVDSGQNSGKSKPENPSVNGLVTNSPSTSSANIRKPLPPIPTSTTLPETTKITPPKNPNFKKNYYGT